MATATTEKKGNALAVPDDQGAVAILLDLEKAGQLDAVSLNLTDPELSYETWEAMGRFLGQIDRSSRWYIGDWLNFGEALYGEQFAQAVDTKQTRYDMAERVTGLDHDTLKNVASICGRIARSRRREELGFWIHAEVAALEPDEQVAWLQRAIDESLNRAELRTAIRDSKAPPAEPVVGDGGATGLSPGERLEAAARVVWATGQATTDGGVLVPAESWAQLGAALGEEN